MMMPGDCKLQSDNCKFQICILQFEIFNCPAPAHLVPPKTRNATEGVPYRYGRVLMTPSSGLLAVA